MTPKDEAVHRAHYRETIRNVARYLRDHGMSDWPIVLERDLDLFVPAEKPQLPQGVVAPDGYPSLEADA